MTFIGRVSPAIHHGSLSANSKRSESCSVAIHNDKYSRRKAVVPALDRCVNCKTIYPQSKQFTTEL